MKQRLFYSCKYIPFLITAFILLTPILFSTTVAADSERTVLRVGFPEVRGFSETDKHGNRYGLVVDYLNEISKYTNWDYEYIDTTSEEMIEQFLNGDFDLIGGTYYSAELANSLAYPNYSCGNTKSFLVAREDNYQLKSYDLKSLNGRKIGVYDRAEESIRRLQQYLAANSLDCELIYYTYEQLREPEGLYEYLNSKDVDMVLDNNMNKTDPYRIIASFEAQPHYIVASSENKELIDGLNMALEKIFDSDPSFAEECYQKNFPDTSDIDIQLTPEELNYIRKKGTVSIAVLKDWHPLFCLNNPDAHNGLLPDILDEITKFTGLTFSYVYADNYTDSVRLVQEGKADMLGFFLGSPQDASDEGLVLSKEYTSLNSIIVRNKTTSYPSKGLTIGLLDGRSLPDTVIASDIRYFSNTSDALSAVNGEEVDLLYGYSSHLELYMQKHHYSNIVAVSLPESPSKISFAMARPADINLLPILNKAISHISPEQKAALLNQNLLSDGNSGLSLIELVYINPFFFIAITVLFLLLLVAAIYLVARSRVRAAVIQSSLEQAQAENKAKGEFLSRMSHEIRTPMNAVVGLADLTDMIDGVPPEVKDNLSKIRSSSRYLLGLINNILDMSRIESGMLTVANEPFSLGHMLNELHDMMNSQAKLQQLEFVFEKEITHDVIHGDEIRLKQVLMNLLSNALKFTPADGRVLLAVKENDSSDDKVSLTFCVSDNGFGIPKQDQIRIFEAFEQIGPNISKSQGTGLGLPISSNIVRLMGGTLTLKSEEGNGSEFSFTISFPQGTLPKKEDAKKPLDSPELLNHIHILLAEDNELNAQIAVSLLKKRGAEVQRVADGNQVVGQFAASAPGTYQVILMDIQMPGKNGLEATQAIRRLDHPDAAKIPIIAMTANSFKEDRDAALDAGMNDFITKPLDIVYLYQVLGRISDNIQEGNAHEL